MAGQTIKTKMLLTADDFFELPDDGKLYELLAGELYVNPRWLAISRS